MISLFTNGYKIPLFDERTEDGKIPLKSIPVPIPDEYPYFVLIDSSLMIRNYYNINDQESMDRMVEHLAIILPREKKSKAVLRPPKEK